ncbi:MAG: hypothetical protein CMJ25_15855 [Phycisphaerae bacterium]|nr:hypothetical protein [Phycisphaerae bacterium]
MDIKRVVSLEMMHPVKLRQILMLEDHNMTLVVYLILTKNATLANTLNLKKWKLLHQFLLTSSYKLIVLIFLLIV